MYASPNQPSIESREDQYFEDLVRDGIGAVKDGHRSLARSLLNRATMIKTTDSRPWLWLSATTDDPQEQRTFLERAVAADPSNVAARRGLAMLSGRLDQTRLTKQGEGVKPDIFSEPVEAQAQTFLCPNCGGHMNFDVQKQNLTCQFCGYIQQSEKRLAADSGEVAVDDVLPTTRAHRWAEAQHRLSCERCGALTLLPASVKADRCPYCGSNRMIESSKTRELVDPQAVGLMKIDEQQAVSRLRQWFGKGITVPDDLRDSAGRIQLRPAYYPFWTFDGTLEIPWTCDVNEGSGDSPRWVPRSGKEYQFFDDVLIPGIRTLPYTEVSKIEPFNLKDVVEFKPEYVAGWPALMYDLAMSDASLLAREKVVRRLQGMLHTIIAGGSQTRNLRTGAGHWSGLTFKHVLLPLWVGTYQYQGKDFRILVNGQTGRVNGAKPRDAAKVVLVTFAVSALILMFIGLLIWLVMTYGQNLLYNP